MTPAPRSQAPAPAAGTARPGRRALLALAYALAFSLFAWWLDRRMLGVAREAYFGWFVLGNALPGLVLAALLTALTRRPGFSFLLVATLQWLVYYASTLKLAVLGEAVGLQDLYFVTSFDPASLSLLGKYVEHPVAIAAMASAAVAVLVATWRFERPAFCALRWTQGALALTSVSLIASLVSAGVPWHWAYRADTLRPSRFSSLGAVLHGGLMSSMVYTHVRNVRTAKVVDTAALQSLLHAVGDEPTPTVAEAPVKPDIVVILSESLFDARAMNGMAHLPDPIPNVRAALESGHGGVMKVPTFGGGTVRTEFEVLTGMPMSAFPDAPFPYVTLVRDHIPSLVSQVEQHGYRTEAIHGNAGSFWNRQNAYRALGFDRFITEREFPPDARRNGRWIADAEMTDMILRELDADGPPKLMVALSIEAHGPYGGRTTTDRAGRDAVQVPGKLDAQQALELRNYLYHVRHADAEFGRLVKALVTRRPTVVLFFGDHLPGLRDVFTTLGFADHLPATQQQVPWVLFRNDRAAPVPTAGLVESWMLPGKVLELAGLADDRYFALTRQVAEQEARTPSPAGRIALRRGLDAAAMARLEGTFEQLALRPTRSGASK